MPSKRVVTIAFSLGMLGVSNSADAACKLIKSVELPVTMVNMQPLVSAKINGAEVQFLADTGAFYSSLTPANAAQLQLPLHAAPFNLHVKGVGGDVDVSVATVKTLTIAGHDLPKVDFLVGGSEVGTSNVGLLGENVLGLADAEYDLANGMIGLMKPEGCSSAAFAYWDKTKPYSLVPMEYTETDWRFSNLTPSPVATAYLNGVRIRVTFDTGAQTSVLSLDAAARAGIKPTSPGVARAGYSSGAGRRVTESWIAPFDSFKVGDEEIKHTKLRIGKIGLDNTDMLLGADFFLSHHVYIANSQHKIYFTYNGGPVFNLSAQPLAAGQQIAAKDATAAPLPVEGDPRDAEGYSRRGQARLSRHDFAGALSDLDRAVELAPTEPRYVQERGMAHAENKQPFLAMQDFDQALKLKPEFIPALLARGEMRLGGREEADALTDFDAVDRLAPKEADQRLLLGGLYSRLQRYDSAVSQFDLWIKAHPVDSRQSAALNGRCWARAQLGQDLQGALADCNASLRQNKTAAALDSRGLVELRLGTYDRAIADYDAALTLSPKMAWSLYGRGIAEIKTGKAETGQADIVDATAVDPALPDIARAHGLPTP